MKIAINALSAKIGGGITYLRNIVPELARQGPGNEYHLLISREHCEKIFRGIDLPGNVTVVKFKISGLINRFISEQILLPIYMMFKRIPVLFCPANVIPFLAPGKKIVWIQNILPFIEDKELGIVEHPRERALNWLSRFSVRRAHRVILSSDNSLQWLLKNGVPESKCRRIYLGANPFNNTGAKKEKVILSVSNIYSHKNQEVLLKGFGRLRSQVSGQYRLVIVGRTLGPKSRAYFERLLRLCDELAITDRVIFENQADQERLRQWYSSASIFVMPSIVESFSFPIFEAMSAGIPVIAANATCLPEVVGEAGLLFNPHDPEDLARKIEKVSSDKDLTAEMIERGRQRAKSFTWENTAQETIKCFIELKK